MKLQIGDEPDEAPLQNGFNTVKHKYLTSKEKEGIVLILN